jgi:hypothetical protein
LYDILLPTEMPVLMIYDLDLVYCNAHAISEDRIRDEIAAELIRAGFERI